MANKQKAYYAKDGALFDDEKAQVYGEHISKLVEKNNDIVTTEMIVSDAEKESSPLHDYFEWDDSVAAVEFRKVQARNLMRSIRIEVSVSEDKETVFVKAFHNVQKKDNGYKTRGYIKFEYAQENEDLYDEFILKRYLTEIKRVNKAYKIYKELEPLTSAIDEILEKHSELMEAV